MSIRRKVAMIGACALFATLAARAGPSGRVVDSAGVPIVGARVCSLIAGAEALCDATDGNGSYALPELMDVVSVRISASGYVPLTVAAVPQETPIVLERAAALLVRVVDAVGGEGLPAARVVLVYSTGRKIGPLPANRAGLSLATLPPGEAVAVGSADGYVETTSASFQLTRGNKSEIVIHLPRAPAAPEPK